MEFVALSTQGMEFAYLSLSRMETVELVPFQKQKEMRGVYRDEMPPFYSGVKHHLASAHKNGRCWPFPGIFP
jgi:hypothetical protein